MDWSCSSEWTEAGILIGLYAEIRYRFLGITVSALSGILSFVRGVY